MLYGIRYTICSPPLVTFQVMQRGIFSVVESKTYSVQQIRYSECFYVKKALGLQFDELETDVSKLDPAWAYIEVANMGDANTGFRHKRRLATQSGFFYVASVQKLMCAYKLYAQSLSHLVLKVFTLGKQLVQM